MAGIGSYLSSWIFKPAQQVTDNSEKIHILSDMEAALEKGSDKTYPERIFNELPSMYKTDPGFVIDIIKLIQSKSGYSYQSIIKILPEELRNKQFGVRIIEEVIFTKSESCDGFEMIRDRNLRSGLILMEFEASVGLMENPIAADVFANLLWTANQQFFG